MPRTLFGYVVVAALTLAACKGKSDTTAATPLDKHCEQLAKACGDDDKHTSKVLEECKAAAPKQIEKGCTEKVVAAYDCFEKELCGKTDKVWTLDDLRVLAERHSKCTAERDLARDCAEKK